MVELTELQEDSTRPADLRSKPTKVTPREAEALGIPWGREPPPARTCEYCGRTIEPIGVVFFGAVAMWRADVRCTCEKAREHWAEYDRAREAEKQKQEAREKQRLMNQRVDKLLGESGIKKRFQMRTFDRFLRDTPGREKSYKAAKEYADNFTKHSEKGEGLYIEGTYGTGKTHLAAAIGLQLIGQGIPVICMTAGDLLAEIKAAFDSRERSDKDVIQLYQRVDLLIIDDLGKEQCSDWSMSTLYTIINGRYEDMKPTIITTNYNAEDLTRALTPRGGDSTKAEAIVSRLRETSRAITMAWADIRGGENK